MLTVKRTFDGSNNIVVFLTIQYYLIRQTSVKSEGYIQKKGRHESLAPASQRIMLTNVGFGLKQSLRNRLHGKGQHCDSFKI